MKRPLAYELLSPVRQQLVLALKRRGHSDMESLAAELFLSPGAVRQNLAGLAAQGIVRYTVVRSGPGRPRHLYQLTRDGQRLFPDFYDDVSVAFATAVDEEAPDVSARVFNRVAEVMFEGLVARVEGKRPDLRLREVVKVLGEQGYLPQTREVDGVTKEIVLGHCPIFALARRHPEICESELRWLQLAAGGATVTRESRNAEGGCAFVLKQD